jgi:hypothetical protein
MRGTGLHGPSTLSLSPSNRTEHIRCVSRTATPGRTICWNVFGSVTGTK